MIGIFVFVFLIRSLGCIITPNSPFCYITVRLSNKHGNLNKDLWILKFLFIRILNADICPTSVLLWACFAFVGASHQLRVFSSYWKRLLFEEFWDFRSSWEGWLSCATDGLVGLVREISLKWKGDICFEDCVSVCSAFLHDTRYCFLAIYVESDILVYKSFR